MIPASKYIVSFFMAIALASPALYGQTQHLRWEPVKTLDTNLKHVAKENDIDVFTAPSVVSLTVNRPVKVQIFTILGKLVSSQNLEPGLYEFKLDTHGVYIIKTPETTCKVAI